MSLRARGFTLVEILIALVILAIALSAAGRATNLSIDAAREVRLKTLAAWVAQNRAAELSAGAEFPAPGESQSTIPMADLSFDLRQTVSDTPNAAFRRVAIVVRPAGGGDVAATLTTYVARVPRRAP
ncbi:MAG: type II secretion system minor pseudopilin GspI [Betaproteobacteria bacterium]|nr:type II secretion system minor pseudopilin GspI [Betaproteobacteria bacterium]